MLVHGGNSYPIRRCQRWQWGYARAAQRLFTETGSTTRDGSAHLVGLSLMPLDPADPNTRAEMAQQFGLDTPHEVLVTFTTAADGEFWRLVLEDLKR